MGVRGIIITSGRGTISRYYTVPRLVHIKMGNFRAFRASLCWFLCVFCPFRTKFPDYS